MDIYINVPVVMLLLALLLIIVYIGIEEQKESQRIIWVGKKGGLFPGMLSKLWAFACGRQIFSAAYFKVIGMRSLTSRD